jgi:hypothetical protein
VVTVRRQPADDDLRQVLARREQALDLLVRALIEIDTLTTRVDVLLARRFNESHREPA